MNLAEPYFGFCPSILASFAKIRGAALQKSIYAFARRCSAGASAKCTIADFQGG